MNISTPDILLIFGTANLLLSFAQPKLSSKYRILLNITPLIFLTITSQYNQNDSFLTGEQSGHWWEMKECKSLGIASAIEVFKAVVKLFSCRIEQPDAFDYTYKLCFAAISVFMLRKAASPAVFSPIFPVYFNAFSLVYGNVRSSLASLLISLALMSISQHVHSNRQNGLSFSYLRNELLKTQKICHKILFFMPFLAHSVGISFPILLIVASLMPRRLALPLRLNLAKLAILASAITVGITIILSLSSGDRILGKSLSFYAGNNFDVAEAFGLPFKHVIMLSIPFAISLLSPPRAAKSHSNGLILDFSNRLYLGTLLIVVILSYTVSAQAGARISVLFFPSVLSMYIYSFRGAAARNAFTVRLLYCVYSCTMLVTQAAPYGIASESILGLPLLKPGI
jgi:hypothetical protein